MSDAEIGYAACAGSQNQKILTTGEGISNRNRVAEFGLSAIGILSARL
jgi:hypothetical protein